jgi:hypothetical protein
LRGWEGWLEERGKHGAARTRERCARLAARTWRRGKVELEEVEEAGEEVEEGLLDEVEGGVAEDRPR